MRRYLTAIVIFAAISVLLFARSVYFDNNLSSDQTFFQLVYLGKTDPAFSDYRVPAMDSYFPFKLTNYLRQWMNDPIWIYRSILPFLIFFYLFAFYWVLKKLIEHEWIAIIVPIISLVPRMALASHYWGILTLGHSTHRSFIQPFFVIFLYLVYHYREHFNRLVLLFFGLGIVSSLYPTQSFYLAAIASLTLLFYQRKLSYIAQAISLNIAFAVGTLYYVLPNLTIGFNIDILEPALISKFNEALRYRFDYTFYPASLYTYGRRVILDVFTLAVIYIFINYKKTNLKPERKNLLGFNNTLLLSTGLITLGLPLVQDIVSVVFRTRLLVFDQFGESKFIYFPLFLGLAIFFEYIWQNSSHLAKYKLTIIGTVVGGVLIVNFFTLQDLIRKFYPLAEFSPRDNRFQELCSWLKVNTDPSKTLLITDDFNLRLCAERKIYANWKEGMVYLYRSPEEFVEWYNRLRRQEEDYQAQDLNKLRLLGSAENKFIVIDKIQWPAFLTNESPLFENQRYILIDASH